VEKRPTISAVRPPSRASTGRALFRARPQDYKWFESYDLALYVDGFLATEQGKLDEALDRFNRILAETEQPVIPDAHMARAESMFNASTTTPGARRIREGDAVPAVDLYGLALSRARGASGAWAVSDEAARRFLQVFRSPMRRQGLGGETKAARRAPGEALKYLVESSRGREETAADDVSVFSSRPAATSAAKIVKALGRLLRGRVTTSEASRPEAHAEARSDRTRCADVRSRRRSRVGHARRLAKLKATYDRLLRTFSFPRRAPEGERGREAARSES